MRKIYALLLFFFIAALVKADQDRLLSERDEAEIRQSIVDDASGFIGTTEATGHNDGEKIERILASAGLSKGDPYCAAFCRYIYDESGLKSIAPPNGWAPSWIASPTWKQGKGDKPKSGDIGGIYFSSMNRVGHVFIIKEWKDDVVVTIEANTSPQAASGSAKDREGEGIWSKRRLPSQIYAVKNWLH